MKQISERKIYYISDYDFQEKEMDIENEHLHGFADVIFNTHSVNVLSLLSSSKGCGTYLMVHISKEAIKMGIDIIELDDCSDRYNKSHNLYTKLGLLYLEAGEGPEMSGYTGVVSKNKVCRNDYIRELHIYVQSTDS